MLVDGCVWAGGGPPFAQKEKSVLGGLMTKGTEGTAVDRREPRRSRGGVEPESPATEPRWGGGRGRWTGSGVGPAWVRFWGPGKRGKERWGLTRTTVRAQKEKKGDVPTSGGGGHIAPHRRTTARKRC